MNANVTVLKTRPKPKVETSRALAFTTAALRKLVADPETPPSLADSKQPGLFLRRVRSGRWSFVFERRIDKRLYRQTLTQWADRCDLDLIRQDAAKLLRDAQTGQWAADLVLATPAADPRTLFTWQQAFEDHVLVCAIRASTQAQYSSALRIIGPHLPALVSDLTGPQWREVFLTAKGSGLPRAGGPARVLSAATASAYARCLSAIWETWAYGFDPAQRPSSNPLKSGMRTGPRKSLWTNSKPRKRRLTLPQAGAFLQALRERSVALDPTRAAALAALELIGLTGMRSGEVLGLTWGEVRGDMIVIGAERMKAKADFTRPITRRVAEIIDAQREITGGMGHVFPSWMKPSTHLVDTRKSLAPIAAAVGVPDLTPHDLRRTWASIAKEQRTDPAIVKRLIGHSLKADVTETNYTAGLGDLLRAEAQRLEDILIAAAGA